MKTNKELNSVDEVLFNIPLLVLLLSFLNQQVLSSREVNPTVDTRTQINLHIHGVIQKNNQNDHAFLIHD